ncbi:MAG: hypothetical protein ACHQDE_07080, partial [Acidimicrobiia bacterium]
KLMGSLVAITLALGIAAAPAAAATRQPVLAGAVHADGTWTYSDGHTESHSADYGLIVAIGGGMITVIRPDLQRVTVALPADTCVRIGGMLGTVDDLHTRMRAVVLSLKAPDGTLSAMAVRAGTPLLLPFQPTCGIFDRAVHGEVTITYRDGSTRTFTWDRGTVTSTDSGQVVVQHADGGTAQAAIDTDTRILGGYSLSGLVGHQAVMVAERIAGDLIAKTVRALS